MAKISILILLLPHLCTILCNETSDNVEFNQSLETKQLNNDNECGISDQSLLELSSTMRESPGNWTWLIAVFTATKSDKDRFELRCAGTLLTNRHVLTAAHCVKLSDSSNTTLHLTHLMVALGFNLNQWDENGIINRKVEKIVIHSDYAHPSADSDLAILILKTPVEFSPSVRPICLWSGSTDLQDVVNKIRYIVFWDIAIINVHTDLPEKLRKRSATVVREDVCVWSNPIFTYITSEHTFCAGWPNRSSPCNGVGGSGLVLFDNTTNRYQLWGFVSRVLRNDTLCDLGQYHVYVDAAKYVPWIRQQISTTS